VFNAPCYPARTPLETGFVWLSGEADRRSEEER
jgi:hypothetical protein